MPTTELTLYQKGELTLRELQEKAKTLQVTDDTIDFAAETLAIAKRLVTVLDEERTAETDPHYRIYKAINDKYSLLIRPCKDIATKVENQIAAYNRAKREEAERKRREYERELAEAERKRQQELKKAEKKGIEPPPAVVLPPPPPVEVPKEKIATTFGNVKIKERWTYDVVAFNQVPREFLMVDEKGVLNAINAKVGPMRNIAGLRIYPEA
jgi:hypothetical protein